MNIGDIMTIIAASVGGGGLGGFFIGKRRRNAEGESIEVDSSVKINREWERLYKELKADYVELCKRVDVLERELEKERREHEKLRNSA